jgi:hypothetical protein
MQLKLDRYVKVYKVQAFLLEARFKTTHYPFAGCLLGQKWGDNVVSLSQFNAVSTFSYRKIFHKTFFPPKPRGDFCNILVLVVVPSQRLLFLPLLCSQASQGLFDSTVYTFCCVLEKVGLGLEFKVAVPFSCELPLVPIWGR